MDRTFRCALLLLCCLLALPLRLVGQQSPAVLPNGLSAGGSVGFFFEDRDYLTSFSLHATALQRKGPSLDLALTTYPSLYADGIYALASDLSLAWGISRAGVTVLPKVGPSAVVGSGGGEATSALWAIMWAPECWPAGVPDMLCGWTWCSTALRSVSYRSTA